MEKKVSIPYHLTAAAGESGFKTLYTVLGGKRLHVTRATVAFPVGTYGELEVALYYGMLRVWPEDANLKGDNMSFEKDVDLWWGSGDPVRLYFKNANATEQRECYVNLEGELV